MSGPQHPRPVDGEEPAAGGAEGQRRGLSPWIHGGLYGLGAHLVSMMGQLLFLQPWLVSRVGEARARALLEDPEGLLSALGSLPIPDLLTIVVAGQGLAVIYTFLLWRALRGGRIHQLGLPEGSAAPRGLGLGALQGAGLIAAVTLAGMAVGGLSFAGLAEDADLLTEGARSAFTLSGLLLLSAFAEEVLFRGYLLRILLEGRSVAIAALGSTLLFGAFHGYNPGAGPLGVVGTALAGLLFVLITLRDGHLWRAVGVHWGWNFSMGFLCSLPISGLAVKGLVSWDVDAERADLWLGGEFGPEGGILGVLVLGAAVVWAGLRLQREGVTPMEPPGPPPGEEPAE